MQALEVTNCAYLGRRWMRIGLPEETFQGLRYECVEGILY